MQTNKTCHRINNNKFWAIHPGRLLDRVYRINSVMDIKNIIHIEIKYRVSSRVESACRTRDFSKQ